MTSVMDRTLQKTGPEHQLTFWMVLACFFLSGWAALVYQTVWMRQFAVVFGTSELAISTVLAAYMAGLAGGAYLASRFAKQIRRPIMAYGLLELGIALGALFVPVGLRLARELQTMIIGGQSQLPDAGGLAQPLFYASIAFLLLLIPTACMGATLPMLTQYAITRDDQIGKRVGALYSINTFGAVVGTLMAGFLILPYTGLFEATLLAVIANVLVFAIAWRLEKQAATTVSSVGILAEHLSINTQPVTPLTMSSWILPLILVSGMVSFTYEVMWSRLLGHIIGGSVYSFATMLATFLTGITLGSAFASRFAKQRESSIWGFSLSQFGAAVMSICMYLMLDEIPGISKTLGAGASTGTELFANSMLCGLVLLPSTIFIGATFPFAVRILAGSAEEAGTASGKVYAWNTIGCVLGAMLSGFWIVPTLGFAGTIYLSVLVSLLLAVGASLLSTQSQVLWKVSLAMVCFLCLACFWPKTPDKILACSPLINDNYQGKLVFNKVGRSSTVRLTDGNGYFLLQNNGLPEALIGMKGTPHFGGTLHRWLSALPIVARPQAESMLVIGFGGGTAVDNVPKTIHTIDVIELEPEVITANQKIARLREHDPLSDPRVHVVLNDARGALSLSDRKYDIIVSQPSHPWTAGASHLYTQEFLSLAKAHLNQDGIMLQWLSSDFIDEDLFRTTGATLLSVFKNVRLYQPNSTALFFLASDSPIQPERSLLSTGEPLKSSPREFARLPINDVHDLLGCLTLDTAGLKFLCKDAAPNTDNRNRLAFESSPTKRTDSGDSLSRFLQPYDPLIVTSSSVLSDPLLANTFKPELVVRRMCMQSMWPRAVAYADSFKDPAQKQFLKAVVARSTGRVDDTQRLLRGALSINPDLEDAKYLLCEQYTNEFLQADVPQDVEHYYGTMAKPQRAVFDASLAMLKDDFATMAKLDPLMASVPVDSLSHVFALYNRAAWRAVPTGDAQQWSRANEAIDLIDRAMTIWIRNSGYMIRMNAAIMADEPHMMLETARQYTSQLVTEADNASSRRDAQQHLPVLQKVIARLSSDPRIEKELLSDVDEFVTRSSKQLLQPARIDSLIVPVSHQTQSFAPQSFAPHAFAPLGD